MNALTAEHQLAIKRRILGLVGDDALPEPLEVTARRLARNQRAKELRAERRHDALVQGLKQACRTWRNPDASSLVYFVRCDEYVKIGFTTRLQQRLEDIMMLNPLVLEVVGCVRGPVQLETAAHAVFDNHHHRGEWFRYNSLVRRAIKLHGRYDLSTAFLNAGQFCITRGTS